MNNEKSLIEAITMAALALTAAVERLSFSQDNEDDGIKLVGSIKNGKTVPRAADTAKSMVLEVMQKHVPEGASRAITGREVCQRVRAMRHSPGVEAVKSALLSLVDAGILTQYTVRQRGGPKGYYWSSADVANIRCPVTGVRLSCQQELEDNHDVDDSQPSTANSMPEQPRAKKLH